MSKESIDRLRVKAQNEQTVLGLAEVLRLERQRVAELQADVEQLRNALMKACGDDADAVQDCIDAVTDMRKP